MTEQGNSHGSVTLASRQHRGLDTGSDVAGPHAQLRIVCLTPILSRGCPSLRRNHPALKIAKELAAWART